MMGRAAYQEPWRLLGVDPLFFGRTAPFGTPKEAGAALIPYIERQLDSGKRLHAVTRHTLALFRAARRAHVLRRHLATAVATPEPRAHVMAEALALVLDSSDDLAHIAA